MKIRTFVLAVFVFVFAVQALDYTVSTDNPDLVSCKDVRLVGNELNIDATPSDRADCARIIFQTKTGDMKSYVVVVYPNDQEKPQLSSNRPDLFAGDAIQLTAGKKSSMFVVRMPQATLTAQGHLKITYANGKTKVYDLAQTLVKPEPEKEDADRREVAESILPNPEFQPQAVPYVQDFASKPEGTDGWQYFSGSPSGRIAVHDGRLLLDDAVCDSSYALNEAILHLNLAGAKDVVLTFDHCNAADEFHAMAPSFAGHDNSDGIAVSADGIAWHSIASLAESFAAKAFPLDALLTKAGVVYTADFRIKFQQYDNYKAPSDGRWFDNISVTATMP